MKILEREIEQYLVKRCKEQGWICLKFSSLNYAGMPDRILIAPDFIMFVECKAPGRKLTTLQKHVHKKLKALHAEVEVVDSYAAVDDLINGMNEWLKHYAD